MSRLSAKLRQAEGGRLHFHCPGCDMVHPIKVDAGGGARPAWSWDGDADRPTFSPSILVQWTQGNPPVPWVCHSFVRGGRIEFLSDCTHQLAGQTVDLPDFPHGDWE